MAFGIYVHIPYCIQRCSYCDFATYEKSSILPPSEYIEFVKKEIRAYGPLLTDQKVDTIYFGGGTPSLVEADLLISILKELKGQGFQFSKNIEITIEINPATIDERKLDLYLENGINRFSVGAQTFRDDLLKRVGREHDSLDTRKTLEILARRGLNYTFDLLFALPGQSIPDLTNDLEIVRAFSPSHLSAYCLTVPEGHPLAKVRLPESEQIEMFKLIETELAKMGLFRYEISNFARPQYESRHNMIYWTDENYWGIGLSAHSYIKNKNWGQRFWNPNNIQQYLSKIKALPETITSVVDGRNSDQFESLTENQSLTDFCHTFLRTMRGLSLGELEAKFGSAREKQLKEILVQLQTRGLIEEKDNRWRLTSDGVLVSNHVFEFCTFLD
ncbi:MAG: putative oxygen-independent coproporphyrinogen oxidase [Pseudomonadota bacterium]|jgi:oxygen-independent coproporphyrinogen-3 oxidase